MLRRNSIRFLSSTSSIQNKLFINGQFVKSSSTFDTINPGNGKIITSVFEATKQDVERAVEIAHNTFEREQEEEIDHLLSQSSSTSVSSNSLVKKRRKNILLHLADCLEKDANYIAKLETVDCGKPIAESKFDIECSVKCLRHYAWLISSENTKGHFEEDQQNLLENDLDENTRNTFAAFKRKEPLGVAALITPFNYPILMSTWKIAPALASGCAVLHKPADQTPLTALRFAEYFGDLLVVQNDVTDGGIFQVLPGHGSITGQALVDHPLVSKISFTGSTQTGLRILRNNNSQQSLKRVSLELGGKSPLVIHKDANLDAAVEAVMLNSFGNQGQICTASSRILCHQDIHDEFVEKLVKEVEKRILIGDCSTSEEFTFGPVISQIQKDKILKFIQSGIDEGVKLIPLKMRNAIPRQGGFFVLPTIFTQVKDEMTIAKEEIFGPVLSILTPYSDKDCGSDKGNLFARCNDTPYGLAAGIFTQDEKLKKLFARKVKAGTIWVNGSFGYSFDQVPFGGYKMSGIGRELGGQDGIDSYMELKSVILEK